MAGVEFVRAAVRLAAGRQSALDVGCGTGGRIFSLLTDAGFDVTGLDVSESMLAYARRRHPGARFVLADVCEWRPAGRYDLIVAWDSIFHVPRAGQRGVVVKLCDALAPGGALLFTAGGVDGEITGRMRGEEFYYSSLDETEYLRALKGRGCKCVLMQRDQHPEEHVVFIAVKL